MAGPAASVPMENHAERMLRPRLTGGQLSPESPRAAGRQVRPPSVDFSAPPAGESGAGGHHESGTAGPPAGRMVNLSAEPAAVARGGCRSAAFAGGCGWGDGLEGAR